MIFLNTIPQCFPGDRSLPAQPVSVRKAQSRKKTTYPCAPCAFLSVSAMFDNTILACETGPFVCIWQACSSRIDQLAAHSLGAFAPKNSSQAPVMQATTILLF